jgi:hypothetical protein
MPASRCVLGQKEGKGEGGSRSQSGGVPTLRAGQEQKIPRGEGEGDQIGGNRGKVRWWEQPAWVSSRPAALPWGGRVCHKLSAEYL